MQSSHLKNLIGWLEARKGDHEKKKAKSTSLLMKVNHGSKITILNQTIDYVKTH